VTVPSDDAPVSEPDRVEELATTIDGLVVTINALTTALEANNNFVKENTAYLKTKIEALGRADARRKKAIRLLFVAIGFDLALTAVVGFLLHGQAVTNDRIRESLRQNYATTQQQAITRVRVLCPLYSVLLAAAADPARAQTLTAAQKATYEKNVQVIRDGYTTLGCQPELPTVSPTH
jgi:Mn2+/Fe2+ NRAMP family transporter